MVRREGIAAVAALLVCISCNKPPARTVKVAGEPQIRATVLTIQTTLQPAKKTWTHLVVIADGRARDMSDADTWRLIDLNKNNVTLVDDITKSYRTESIQSLVLDRRAIGAARLPDHIPSVQFISTGAKRVVQGVTALQSLVRVGAYQRELWIADHPSVPSNLFAVLYVSDSIRSPLDPMMRAVDDSMIAMHGLPLADHAELPYGKSKMVVDRNVMKIEQRNVPQSWLQIDRSYKEIKEPAAGRPPASSPRPSRSTPATESQSSATSRKTP